MTPNASRIVDKLRAGDGKHLESLSGVVVDGLLEARVDQLVDVDEVLGALDAALDRGVSVEMIERCLKPAAARERKRARKSGEPVGAFFPQAQAEALLGVIRRPFPVDPRIVRDLVGQKAVRSMLGAVVREAIQGFVTRTPLPGLSMAAKMVGNLSKRLDQHVGEFLDKSMARLTGRLAELALSGPGQELIAEAAAEMAQTALKTPVSFYYDELAKLPVDELWALLPPILAHNLARPEIRKALSGEVAALLGRDGQKTARELLDELGILDRVRSLAVARTRAVLGQVIDQPAFARWLDDLLD